MNMVPTAVSKQAFRTLLILKKNSPNLMFVGGMGGFVATTILACRATLKLSEELPQMRADLEAVREVIEDPDDLKKALAMTYALNVGKVARMYAPAVVVGGLSIGALTGSHVSLTRRNAGLTAGYAALSEAFNAYRERTQEELGKDREKELYRALTTEKAVLEEGKKAEKVELIDPNKASVYSRFFDECSTEWTKDAVVNRLFIQAQEKYANDLLLSRGHLFLNEVYDMLGFERTKAGQVVGWVVGPNKRNGDTYVDFGMLDVANSRFVNGWERSCHLDFNVDGPVYDLI